MELHHIRAFVTLADELNVTRAAERLHLSAQKLDDTFFAQLKSVYTDPQIVELVATAAAFELFPRLVDGLRIPTTPIPEPVAGKQD